MQQLEDDLATYERLAPQEAEILSYHDASKLIDPQFRWNFKVATFLTKTLLCLWCLFGCLATASSVYNIYEFLNYFQYQEIENSVALNMYEIALIIQAICGATYFVLMIIGLFATMRSRQRFALVIFVLILFTILIIVQVVNTVLFNMSIYWLSRADVKNNYFKPLVVPWFFFSTSAVFSILLIVVHVIMWLLWAYYAVQAYIRNSLIEKELEKAKSS